TFTNHGTPVFINRAMSPQLDLPDADYDFLQFSGTWSRERHLYRNHLPPGSQSIESARGHSSHQENPFFILARPHTANNHGAAFGFNFIYSGNFKDEIEVDQFDTTRVLVGINPLEFGWHLKTDATFQTPEAVLTYTSDGLNALRQQLGRVYNHHLLNPRFVKQERPILINNWEA